ncbi:MAG TPA: lysophospholipid acyltransferase family protein [Usitatibacteraceae bacterium]|nr:lysophospholipid acyltransferase family protein [Usitatibacteraceae bacterium]
MSAALPVVPPAIPRRGSALWRWIGRTVMRISGWRFEGAFPDTGRLVIAVAPHTSNWDFVHGAAAMFALDLELSFIGKHTLFVWPFAAFFRWMGGIPVNRSAAHGVVGQAVDSFRNTPSRVLAIAPEGTRRKVERFKTGFLHIARGAGVPVLLIGLDYPTRTVRIGPVIEIGADIDAERRRVEAHFATVTGRHPQ